MFVELAVGQVFFPFSPSGVLNNSLGLVSDAGHMLFDSSALVIGLIASYMAEWPANDCYSMGYRRVEVLSGFINGVFLVFVGLSVASESVERNQWLYTWAKITGVFSSFWFKFILIFLVTFVLLYILLAIIRNHNRQKYSKVRRKRRL